MSHEDELNDPWHYATVTGNSKDFHLRTAYIKSERCYIPLGRQYADGSTAWQIISSDDHSPMATATVCLSAYGLTPKHGHVFIKSYSENEGMYEGLKSLGIIGEHIECLSVGHVIQGVYHCPINYDKLVG